jgi:tripartite-type tricarboxylate transporter receptor subunit TctC
LPDVPAIAELLPGFEATAWVGIFAPAHTPADIVAKVQGETLRVVELPDIAHRLRELGATPVANPPSEFAAFVKQDTEKWRRLVATAKIQVEQ